MKYAPHRRITWVAPLMERHGGDDTQMIGDCRPVLLDCGHIVHGNPIMMWKVGSSQPCHHCQEATK